MGVYQNRILMTHDYTTNGFTTLVLYILDINSVPRDKTTSASLSMAEARMTRKTISTPRIEMLQRPLVVAGIKVVSDMGVERIAAVGYSR